MDKIAVTLNEFKKFLIRGNVVDLAVAVMIGTAFTAVVTSLVKDIITPLIAAIGGQPDFSGLTFTVNNSKFMYGSFINAVIAFVILAAVVFFVVIKPVNHLMKLAARREAQEEAKEEAVDPQLELLREIRDELKKRK
ncbi:MAG: large conductance mechanosensitive channel protein [Candidatus Saccharibacteria bacterium]|nr:large conductance mechanosensitive channel protein [Candidatus Saccharibacteria bacterium]